MSEKKLQDYIPYYIGCRCLNTWFPDGHEMYNNNWILNSIDITSPKPFRLDNQDDTTWTDSIKPILRRLESITDEECWEMDEIDTIWVKNTSHEYKSNRLYLYKEKCIKFNNISPGIFNYLLKKHFDLFGLIDSKLAIDSATLPKIN